MYIYHLPIKLSGLFAYQFILLLQTFLLLKFARLVCVDKFEVNKVERQSQTAKFKILNFVKSKKQIFILAFLVFGAKFQFYSNLSF